MRVGLFNFIPDEIVDPIELGLIAASGYDISGVCLAFYVHDLTN